MPDWLLVVLLILTVYRITRLVISDAFPPIGVPRKYFLQWLNPSDDWVLAKKPGKKDEYLHPKARPHLGAFGRSIHYLFGCPWCMSFWVGAVVIAVTHHYFIEVPYPIFVLFAASAITGLLNGLEEKLS